LPQHEKGHGIGRRSVTFFWVLIGLFGSHTKSTKNPPTFIRRWKVPRFSRSGNRSPAHRPFRVKAPCRLQRQVAGFGFPESLLMLRTINNEQRWLVKFVHRALKRVRQGSKADLWDDLSPWRAERFGCRPSSMSRVARYGATSFEASAVSLLWQKARWSNSRSAFPPAATSGFGLPSPRRNPSAHL
jgi:hypothetical protein